MATKKKPTTTAVEIMTISRGEFECCLLGTTPLLHNRLSEKARRQLLLPPLQMTRTEKQNRLKHVPLDEYQASPYSAPQQGPTLIQHLSAAFRGAMRSAALDLPGITKAETGRMIWVVGDRVDIYGVPQLDMRIVKQAGRTGAPDVRTRMIMPTWACRITVSYVIPNFEESGVVNLLAAAGISIGIGDYRNEKGAGNYGLWDIVSEDDPRYLSIIKHGGRDAQQSAMDNPSFYNEETEDLYRWWIEEAKNRRSFKPAVPKKESKKSKANGKNTGASA